MRVGQSVSRGHTKCGAISDTAAAAASAECLLNSMPGANPNKKHELQLHQLLKKHARVRGLDSLAEPWSKDCGHVACQLGHTTRISTGPMELDVGRIDNHLVQG